MTGLSMTGLSMTGLSVIGACSAGEWSRVLDVRWVAAP
jgi:hypothetical protein